MLFLYYFREMRRIFYFIKSLLLNINCSKIKVSLSSRIKTKKALAGCNKIGKNTYICGHIGKYSYVGQNCVIYGDIGRFSSISHNVKCIVGEHPLKFVSTSPSFYSIEKQNNISFTKKVCFQDNTKMVQIGNDVWIGENVLIKGGVKIGDGAVIGMGSVVVKDVPPFSIVAGNPAKIIRMRFDEDTINAIQKSKWWNKETEFFKNNQKLFLDTELFINEIAKK